MFRNVLEWVRIHSQGFSLIELLTTVSIIGTLSVVGIRSYQAQTNKARSAEAKHSLSYVYTAEEGFYDSWGCYHENLLAVGAVPTGSYYYDVGFGKSVALTYSSCGDLDSYPSKLDIRQCTSFREICNEDCFNNIPAAKFQSPYLVGTPTKNQINCKLTGKQYLKNYGGTHASTADAKADEFSALAIGKLRNVDIWSINEEKEITHQEDGTQ